MGEVPSMICRGSKPLAIFPVNGSYILAVYQGSISEFDLLLRYRQKDLSAKSGWTRIRTPKHIHWAVDVLLKMASNKRETEKFLDFLLTFWQTKVSPIKTESERDFLLSRAILDDVSRESKAYEKLAEKGEYSVKFLLLVAKLLMFQEKTNNHDAYMFKELLQALRDGKDIFKIVSVATHRR
jgi:hypothetical protein